MKQIILEENISMENIKTFYDEVTLALENESHIVIDFSRVKNVGLSLRLVLIYCFRRARKKNIVLKTINIPDEVMKIMKTNLLV